MNFLETTAFNTNGPAGFGLISAKLRAAKPASLATV